MDSRHCQIVNIVKKPRMDDQSNKIYVKRFLCLGLQQSHLRTLLTQFFPITLIIDIELNKSKLTWLKFEFS